MGFQHLTREARASISSKGGKARTAAPHAHQFDSERGATLGQKGGRTSPTRFTSETGALAGKKKKGKTKR